MPETLGEGRNRVQAEAPNSRWQGIRERIFWIGSRSGAAGRSIRAALSVRCGKLLEFGAGLGQGIFYHLRREFFRADTEFVGRVGKWASASRPINRCQSGSGRVS